MIKNVDAGERKELSFDSTQTLRALTPRELAQDEPQKWFAVQLAVSDQPPNLDIMPRLDLFASHRLYVVIARSAAFTRHALRLGFFEDPASATAACDSLKTYFSAPSVVRVSAAEQERFVPRLRPAITPQSAPTRTATVVPFKPSSARAPDVQAPPPPAAPMLRPSVKPGFVATGSQKLTKKSKSLAEELMEEAREVQRAKRRKGPAQTANTGSWLTRLFGVSKT